MPAKTRISGLAVNTDNYVKVYDIRIGPKAEIPISIASVTVQVIDTNGVKIGNEIELIPVADTNDAYEGNIPYTTPIEDGEYYYVERVIIADGLLSTARTPMIKAAYSV